MVREIHWIVNAFTRPQYSIDEAVKPDRMIARLHLMIL